MKFINNYRAVIESVVDSKNLFLLSHKGKQLPRGIWFLFNFICLTSGLFKRVMTLDVDKNEKRLLLKWLRQLYRRNDITWDKVIGPYNKISYIILMSPLPYSLFRYYFKHLKAIAKIVDKTKCFQ